MPKLNAEKRSVKGRRVRRLRREGFLPANIYGKGVASLAVQVSQKEFEKVFDETGETGLVELVIGKQIRPVLVSNIQKDPVRDNYLHADFRQVNLKEKITSNVPVELVGESPAEKNGIGIVVQNLHEVEVAALPTDLPESFEIDMSALENVDDEIKVGDLKASEKVGILNDKEQGIVRVVEPREEEEETSQPTPEDVEVSGEKPVEQAEQKQKEKPAAGGEDKDQGKEE